VKRFGYVFDPLFLLCCGLYALNRWLIKPHCEIAFFHNWFNDVLLIPCALPPVLLTHRWLGLRRHDRPPTFGEVAAHWAGWSVLFEVIGPRIMPTTGDPWDVVAYGGGALMAVACWRRLYSGAETDSANFDLLAPYYGWMEWALAGRKLQRCRAAFLETIPAPRRALIVGQGHGAFVAELLGRHPAVRCTCVDSSARMLAEAGRRVREDAGEEARVEFVQADILEWEAPAEKFDLIVTHFVLDCFPPEQLDRLLPKLGAAAEPEALWLLADFREPAAGPAKWRARAIIEVMYLFFRWATGLPATGLTPPDSRLAGHGFSLSQRRTFDWGLLHSDLWVRGRDGSGSGHSPPRRGDPIAENWMGAQHFALASEPNE
jgi:ubiquinone/menaquinone biosynthesis C-methylase UbiE